MRGTAERLGKEAIRRILTDEAAARRLGRALIALQQGKERLDRTGDRALELLGIAGREEWKRLSRRLAGIGRRLREADQRLSRLERDGGRARPSNAHENPPKSRRSSVDR